MNHYYPAVPPVSNAYYYQRRQPPPAAIPHTPPPQPNPYAPPYIPVAALPPQPLLPLQHSPSHYSRPPTIVSSTPLQPQPQPPPPPPPLPIPSLPPPPPVPAPVVPPPPPAPVSRIPTYPLPGVLPWLSVPNEPFPGRPRRRRRQIAAAKPPRSSEPASSDDAVIAEPNLTTNITGALLDASPDAVTSSSTNAPVLTPTPTTSTSQPMTSKAKPATVPVHTPAVPLPVVPVLPHVPALPLTAAKPTSTPKAKREAPAAVPVVPKEESTTTAPQQATIEPASAAVSEVTTAAAPVAPVVPAAPAAPAAPAVPGAPGAPAASVGPSAPAAPPVPSAPQTRTVSWAELVKSSAPGGNVAKPVLPKANGSLTNGKATLADLLKSFDGTKITAPVIEPRGLVNTGNMCYMNAILQMLMFCGPFYHFLDMLAKKVTHSFKGDTPLIDTMVVFLREFRVLGSNSVYQNLSGHKEKEYLETFGEPFVPEFVYGALREIQRFSSMRRGHQHDAEEFLGFFLDELHEELVRVLKKAGGTTESSPAASDTSEDGWLEVGPKQKAASTRTITILESPITRIFGGQLRSEFKVKGEKSVSVEPYQPLQLDIQSPQVNTIVDALKQLTKPETIHGNFGSTKGAAATTATKQVFIDTLPPVLILHLKRFQYDNQGGTQKIWKKIGYPLQLDIPKEALSPKLRLSSEGTRYKLIGVVYHHGKSASGGHYTVDVLRQDGKNWIRFDDTNIKGVHTDEVKVDVDVKVNPLSGKNGADDEDGWETVNNDVGGAVNGSQAYGKDSKVAYILFYQRN